MASAPADFRSPESTPINYCLIMGQQSPYCEVLNLSAPRRLRVMQGFGFDGAAVAFGGFEVQKFSVKFYLRDDKDWDDWAVFKQLLTKATTKNQSIGATKVERTMDFWHPLASDDLYGIHAVTIEDVGGYVREGDSGEWSVEVKFISAMKPQNSFASVENAKDQPLDAKDREIQDNSTKIGKNQSTIDALKNQRTPPP